MYSYLFSNIQLLKLKSAEFQKDGVEAICNISALVVEIRNSFVRNSSVNKPVVSTASAKVSR